MKKKVAVVLAAIMALSPISAFAATKNELTKQPTNVVEKTLFMEETWRDQGMVNPIQDDADTDDIKYAVDGTTLKLYPLAGKTFKTGDAFKVTLTNAEWFFRQNGTLNINNNQLLGLAKWLLANSNGNISQTPATLSATEKDGFTYTLSGLTMSQDAINRGIPREVWNRVYSIVSLQSLTNALNYILDEAYGNPSYPTVDLTIRPAFEALFTATNGHTLTVSDTALANFILLCDTNKVAMTAELGAMAMTPTALDLRNFLSIVTGGVSLDQQTVKFKDQDLLDDLIAKTLSNPRSNFADASTRSVATYNTSMGAYFATGINNSTGTYFRFADYKESQFNNTNVLDVDYIMTVSESNNSVATLRIMNGNVTNVDGSISIPLVSLTNKQGDVRVEVAPESNTSIVTRENLLYGQSSTSNTKTTVKTKIDSKYTFYLDQLIIAETVPNSLQRGQIILTAPYGYKWANPAEKTKILNENTDTYETDKYVEILAEEDLFFGEDNSESGNRTKLDNKDGWYIQRYKTDKNGVEKEYSDRLVIDTNEMLLKHSGRTTGRLVIKGLSLMAEDYAPLNEEVKIEIRDYDDDTEDVRLESYKDLDRLNNGVFTNYSLTESRVTKENVVVGNRKDWGVKFERVSDITTLVSGRYEPIGNSTEFDKEHKVANVKFSENVVASWWALRESEFTLTDGVKFRQVKITDDTNFDYTNNRFGELDKTYKLSKDRQGYVFLDASKLRIVDLEIVRDKTASFKMETWVSIEPGFEGDIQIKAGGNDILKETEPVIVAKAVAPITVASKVKDVKIGYQWQKVEDITITETAAGRLKRDTVLQLFVDDDITGADSIAIAPDFVTEVNETSNIKFSKPAVESGSVVMNIERASYKTPATIKLSNVYVKIDRTVPESNKKPYKIVAGGSAVAANYVGNNEIVETYTDANGDSRTREVVRTKLTIQSDEPLFSTKGIGVDYLNVVTSAPDKDSILSNIVTVKNGSNELKVGNATVTMDTEAFISAESNSMMVPVRFVAVALGIADDQVKWDNEARTVTIYNGARVIQFTLGKSEIIVNGVKSTIYSPDVPPIKVNAEVKDNRSFLPFRALGTALGVDVDYDATTQAATYNAGLLKDNAAAAAAEATQTPATTTTTPATTPAK